MVPLPVYSPHFAVSRVVAISFHGAHWGVTHRQIKPTATPQNTPQNPPNPKSKPKNQKKPPTKTQNTKQKQKKTPNQRSQNHCFGAGRWPTTPFFYLFYQKKTNPKQQKTVGHVWGVWVEGGPPLCFYLPQFFGFLLHTPVNIYPKTTIGPQGLVGYTFHP